MKIFLKICLVFALVFSLGKDFPALAQEGGTEEEAAPEAAAQDQIQAQAATESASAESSVTTTPVLEIKKLETEEPLYSLELRDVDITDLFRVLAHDYKLNLMVDKDVEGKVTASLTNVSLEEALETIAESQNLILKKKGNIIKVLPNLITKTFMLKYVEAKKVLESSDSESSSETASTETTGSESELTQASTIYDLLSGKGKVFLGKQPNSIIVIDYPPNIEKIEEYFKVVDQRMASRVFKLKYLKAEDVVGEATTASSTSTSTESSETGTSETSTTTSGS